MTFSSDINKSVFPELAMVILFTELVFSGEGATRNPPHLGQLQHRQQQPVYPL